MSLNEFVRMKDQPDFFSCTRRLAVYVDFYSAGSLAAVASPYWPPLIPILRTLGGARWDVTAKVWMIPTHRISALIVGVDTLVSVTPVQVRFTGPPALRRYLHFDGLGVISERGMFNPAVSKLWMREIKYRPNPTMTRMFLRPNLQATLSGWEVHPIPGVTVNSLVEFEPDESEPGWLEKVQILYSGTPPPDFYTMFTSASLDARHMRMTEWINSIPNEAAVSMPDVVAVSTYLPERPVQESIPVPLPSLAPRTGVVRRLK